MEVTKLKLEYPDGSKDTIEKGKIFINSIVEHIIIDNDAGLILLDFREGSDWEYKLIYTQNVDSICYSGIIPAEKAKVYI